MSKDIKQRIAQAIKKGRKKKGWNQSELREKLGVSFSIISKWEVGDKTPGGETLVELIRMLDILPEIFPEYTIHRKSDIEQTLNEHEQRIKRLENILKENNLLV